MNNINLVPLLFKVASLFQGRKNQGLFNRRNNNGSMLLWSMLGIIALGLLGSLNTRWRHSIQETVQNLGNSSNGIMNQMNVVTEFSDELNPFNMNKK